MYLQHTCRLLSLQAVGRGAAAALKSLNDWAPQPAFDWLQTFADAAAVNRRALLVAGISSQMCDRVRYDTLKSAESNEALAYMSPLYAGCRHFLTNVRSGAQWFVRRVMN